MPDMNEQLILQIRMQLAALRQWLRDMAETLTDDETNLILDQIIRLTDILRKLEEPNREDE
ncbi:hypothetical protein BLX24_20895 [Arsenicibacter rosenii]|uniref:Uncharacterized protein n=2 Tax=Arsenicibacter rosenii TaxID=1750698 RepID=A0A1S2VH58_9BACT|nr:hypothetical protein BLX24_20895 [Arsenicibacter rosenii]